MLLCQESVDKDATNCGSAGLILHENSTLLGSRTLKTLDIDFQPEVTYYHQYDEKKYGHRDEVGHKSTIIKTLQQLGTSLLKKEAKEGVSGSLAHHFRYLAFSTAIDQWLIFTAVGMHWKAPSQRSSICWWRTWRTARTITTLLQRPYNSRTRILM